MKLLIGGSPCTHWSIAQSANGKRETEPKGQGWELFKNYLIAKNRFKPDLFLYENNKSAAQPIKNQISAELAVPLQYIDSALVSAQRRQRFYAHNFGDVPLPEDRGILLQDILEQDPAQGRSIADTPKARCLLAVYGKNCGTYNYERHLMSNNRWGCQGVPVRIGIMPYQDGCLEDTQGTRVYAISGKAVSVKANGGGGGAKTGLYAVPACLRFERTAEAKRARKQYENHEISHGYNELRELHPRPDGKSNTLTTVQKDNLIIDAAAAYKAETPYEVKNGFITIKGETYPIKLPDGYYIIRKLTVTECCRLQTLPDDYCRAVSATQAYKGLGNGWTAEVIIHLLSHALAGVPRSEPLTVLSMYDGIGTGRYCLDKLGFTDITYYAYEIDKYAKQIAMSNYPDIIHCGDAFDVREDDWFLSAEKPPRRPPARCAGALKIGLWSDAVNFPSLPLMKISAYHKARGNIVKMINDFSERFDIAYCSKTFNLPALTHIPQLPAVPLADYICLSGTGVGIELVDGMERYIKDNDPDLPKAIEHTYPDYKLYPSLTKDTAFGFLTRGCGNGCGFCVVTGKEGERSVHAADLSEFWRGQRNITVMDANLLACDKAEELLHALKNTGANIDFTQGLDARFVDESTARILGDMKISMAHFAFDLMKNEAEILRGLTLFRKHFHKSDRHCSAYILTNFNTTHEEDWYRVQKVMELGYRPDVRIYQKGTQDRFHTDLARWANNTQIYRSCSFADFIPRTDGKRCGELYGNIIQSNIGGNAR